MPAVLFSVRAHDKRIACEEEFSDSEDEAEGQGGGRRNAANHKKPKRVKKEEEKEGEEKKGNSRSQDNLVFGVKLKMIILFICLVLLPRSERGGEGGREDGHVRVRDAHSKYSRTIDWQSNQVLRTIFIIWCFKRRKIFAFTSEVQKIMLPLCTVGFVYQTCLSSNYINEDGTFQQQTLHLTARNSQVSVS